MIFSWQPSTRMVSDWTGGLVAGSCHHRAKQAFGVHAALLLWVWDRELWYAICMVRGDVRTSHWIAGDGESSRRGWRMYGSWGRDGSCTVIAMGLEEPKGGGAELGVAGGMCAGIRRKDDDAKDIVSGRTAMIAVRERS